MNQWQDLNRIALLGTQRAELPETKNDSPIGALLADLDSDEKEQAFLKMAGTLGLYELVGQMPPQIAQLPDSPIATPTDDQPSCSPALAERLSLMMDGRFRELLPDCLQAMAEVGQRLPDRLLPDLLERGEKAPLIRPYLLPVLGKRGQWLAAQNPNWAYAAADAASWANLSKKWRTEDGRKRHALIRQLRHSNPNGARQLVESSWKSEPMATRSSFIRLMEIGLSMADEPFLEAALDDRDFQIRRKAAELLTFLPQSRLCQRMKQNTQFVLRWAPHQTHQIVVSFPGTISDQLVRDGVTRDVGKNAARGRSRQLVQMVSAIPLDYWTEKWQATPEEIVTAVQTSRWPRTLTQGLTTAAQRQKNVDWAMALLTQASFLNVAAKLIPVLPIEKCKFVIQQLDNETEDTPSALKDSPLLRVLRYWQQPWDEELGRFWLDFVANQVRQDTEDKPGPFARTAVKNFARHCPPHLADYAAQLINPLLKTHPSWRMTLVDLTAVLTFRQAMYDELS